MPTCNLAKTMHNIWLQQSRNCDTCMYATMSDDYVQTFKQSTLYKQYLQGGLGGHGPDRNELLLRRAQQYNDHARLLAAVANYTSRSCILPRGGGGFWVCQATH